MISDLCLLQQLYRNVSFCNFVGVCVCVYSVCLLFRHVSFTKWCKTSDCLLLFQKWIRWDGIALYPPTRMYAILIATCIKHWHCVLWMHFRLKWMMKFIDDDVVGDRRMDGSQHWRHDDDDDDVMECNRMQISRICGECWSISKRQLYACIVNAKAFSRFPCCLRMSENQMPKMC